MNIYILSDEFPWFGSHTGYSQLPRYLREADPDILIIQPRPGPLDRWIGKAYSLLHGWWSRHDSVRAAAEFRFSGLLAGCAAQGDMCHILYFDLHHYFWERWRKAPRNVMATIHHPPPRRIPDRMLRNLSRLSSAIILCQADLSFYESCIGRDRVRFIHHGVDIAFFHPAAQNNLSSRRILFAGHNGRNTQMLHRVIARLTHRQPTLQFDLLVPRQYRYFSGLEQLTSHGNVRWHERLSDEALRELYQTSYLLLLPMESCSANNAIVESLACGLPIVTTDIGGIRDYGGASVYPLVSNNDDDSMIALLERYLGDPGWRNEVARNCRQFAEQNLSWPLIAKQHLEAYQAFLS